MSVKSITDVTKAPPGCADLWQREVGTATRIIPGQDWRELGVPPYFPAVDVGPGVGRDEAYRLAVGVWRRDVFLQFAAGTDQYYILDQIGEDDFRGLGIDRLRQRGYKAELPACVFYPGTVKVLIAPPTARIPSTRAGGRLVGVVQVFAKPCSYRLTTPEGETMDKPIHLTSDPGYFELGNFGRTPRVYGKLLDRGTGISCAAPSMQGAC